jgi:protein SCO1/2
MKKLPQRRKFLLAGLCAGMSLAYGDCHAHGSVGYVAAKIVIPPSIMVRVQKKEVKLADLVVDRVTAVQFMFTSCSSICPVQGATFAELQRLLAERNVDNARLLSLSIDELGDDDLALKNWLHKFSAGPRWSAGALTAASVTPAYNVLEEQADPAYRHSSKVYIFDQTGRLVWRTAEFPRAQDVIKLMEKFAGVAATAANTGR